MCNVIVKSEHMQQVVSYTLAFRSTCKDSLLGAFQIEAIVESWPFCSRSDAHTNASRLQHIQGYFGRPF